MHFPRLQLIAGFILAIVARSWAAPAQSPSPLASPAPSPSASPSPAASLTAQEAATLYKEFQRAQKQELQALEHRHSAEMKELKAAQKAQYKEWEAQEKKDRRERGIFKEGYGGKKVREYVQDFTRRREAFWAIQKDERARRDREYEVRRNSIREDQSARIQEFKSALDRGERPPLVLWPATGH